MTTELKKWDLVTPGRFARLLKERQEVLEYVASQTYVGGSILVEMTPEFRTEKQVGRFGRLEMDQEKTTVCLAPALIKRELHMQIFQPNSAQWGEQLSYGLRIKEPVASWPKARLPKPLKQSSTNHSRRLIEHAIFSRLAAMGEEVTLVNPSFATMASLQNVAGRGFITLSSGENQAWTNQLKDFIRNGGNKLKMLPPRVSQGVAYLGEGNFKWVPNISVRLVQSPFFDWSKEGPSRIEGKDGVYVVYTTKDYGDEQVSFRSEFTGQQGTFISNPESTDHFAGARDRRYFIESDLDLGVQDVPSFSHSIHPQMSEYKGEWQEVAGRMWKIEGSTVYDWHHKGRQPQGTYFSRRLVSPPAGYSWDKLGEGSPFNISSLSPMKDEVLKTVKVQGMSITQPKHHHLVDSIEIQVVPSSQYDERYKITKKDKTVVFVTGHQTLVPIVCLRGGQVHDLLNALDGAEFIPALQGEGQLFYSWGKSKGSFFALDRLTDMNKYATRFLSVPQDSTVSGVSLDPDGTICWSASMNSQDQIHRSIGQFSLRDWAQQGFSLGQWARETEYTEAYLRGYVLRVVTIHYWKDLRHVVSEDSISLRLEGQVELGFWDGQLLVSLLEQAAKGVHSFRFRQHPSTLLIEFLRLNSGYVTVEEGGGGFNLNLSYWKRRDN